MKTRRRMTASNDGIKNEKMSREKGKTFQLQFVDNTECFERLVKKWKLERESEERRQRNEEKEDFAGGRRRKTPRPRIILIRTMEERKRTRMATMMLT